MFIKTGTKNSNNIIVTDEMTAFAIKSGAAKVLSTPCMIALMESVSCDAIAQFLDEGYISVGTMVNIKHFKATPVGKTVQVSACILEVDGAKVLLEVVCEDKDGLIGKGTHGRYVVHHQTFMENIKD